MSFEYRPHQEFAYQESKNLWRQGYRSWCIQSPCGAGKTAMMLRFAIEAVKHGKTVHIYAHRVMLIRQLIERLEAEGLTFGVIAATARGLENPIAPIQICSMPTVLSRYGNSRYDIRRPDIVLIDEAHQQASGKSRKLLLKFYREDSLLIGFSATPVGLGGLYEKIIVAGNHADMLACNAHVPIVCYAPNSPDLSRLKTEKNGEFSEESNRSLNNPAIIIGSVYEHWRRLNPDQLPAIGFAPGVAESKWFVEQFRRRGVACAHIDSDRTILVVEENGQLVSKEFETTDELREEVILGSREGRYKIVWNRFVLREAIDMPWLYHCILATSIGGLATYIQSVGRVMRYSPGQTRSSFRTMVETSTVMGCRSRS